ncbi:winged helix-turn-helix transcriptional regulator [Candidatus Pacearchaeota archaeon]|nr:winged helix-turn-helix transcriptional regulator [Candidatus Pacearchaeota archaeon]
MPSFVKIFKAFWHWWQIVNRKKVFLALSKPKTPTEISKEVELNLGYISNIIISLMKRKLIECLNPGEKRYRLYRRTKKGEGLIGEIRN